MKRFFFFAVVVGLLLQSARSAPKNAQAGISASPIVIDGKLAEPAWEKVAWSTGFHTIDRNLDMEEVAVQTRFKAVYTADHVYVAVECDEPNLAGLKSSTPWRDGSVWQDDCVEIFFDPSNSGRYYHQIMVNSKGTIFDLRAADFGLVKSRLWNGAFRAAGDVDVAAKKWRVEVEIPLGTLVLAGDAGSSWLWNVSRERHAGGKLALSSWSKLQGNFHLPEKFGRMTGMPSDYTSFRLRMGEPEIGVSRAASGVSRLKVEMPITNETGRPQSILASAAFADGGKQVVAEQVVVPDRGQKNIVFPVLESKKKVSETDVVFTFANSRGMVLKKLYRSLSCEVRPLTLTLQQPCYRNAIYPGETVRSLRFDLEADEQTSLESRTLQIRFVSATGGMVAQRDLPFGGRWQKLELPIPELEVGDYRLSVQAQDATGKTVATLACPIRKLAKPEKGTVVRVDRNRNLLVDGKPFLGIGWYGGIPEEDPRPEVIAMQNVTVPTVLAYKSKTNVLAEKYAKGVYSIVSVEPGRLLHTFGLWRKENAHLKECLKDLNKLAAPSAELCELARKVVERVRHEPGLLGYYIADEPEIHNVRSECLAAYYQVIRELDPFHPVFITNDTIDGIVSHGYKCADVLSPDPYSVQLDYMPSFLKKVREVAQPGQTWWVTPWHSASDTHFKRPMGSARPYSYRVFRNQMLGAFAYGARGFTGYTSAFFLPEIEYRYGLPPVWRELRLLEPFMAEPEPEGLSVPPTIDIPVFARRHGGQHALVAVNHKEEKRLIPIVWPDLVGCELRNVSTGETRAVETTTFTLELEPGEVALLTDVPAAGNLPTVAQVEAELVQHKKAAIRPGNLLHWSRGVRASCSKGAYAPWFDNFFYYAINGIRDDQGWFVSHAKSENSWFEVSLPKATKIGRVELFSPNLREYRLEFFAPDGSSQSHVFRNEGQEHMVHGFSSPTPVLKLRLTVLRSEGKVGVSEMEAYRERGDAPLATSPGKVKPAPKSEGVLFPATGDGVFLWEETFKPFAHAPKFYWKGKDDKWVVNLEQYRVEEQFAGIRTASCSPTGYAGMSHFFPYSPSHRFLQVSIGAIEGEGYRFSSLVFGDGSGKTKGNCGVNSNRPGIFTVDTWSCHEGFRPQGKQRKCFIRLGSAGSGKHADGRVKPGPEITYNWLRLAAVPRDGLAVTLADGGPLPKVLQRGDCLHFEVQLEQSAVDVVVEITGGPGHTPINLDGQAQIKLVKADPEGRIWTANLALDKGCDSFKCGGYPLVFEAIVSGGSIAKSYFSAHSSIK